MAGGGWRQGPPGRCGWPRTERPAPTPATSWRVRSPPENRDVRGEEAGVKRRWRAENGKTRTEVQPASVHGKHEHAHTLIPPLPPTTLLLLTYNPLCHHLPLSPRLLPGDVRLPACHCRSAPGRVDDFCPRASDSPWVPNVLFILIKPTFPPKVATSCFLKHRSTKSGTTAGIRSVSLDLLNNKIR